MTFFFLIRYYPFPQTKDKVLTDENPYLIFFSVYLFIFFFILFSYFYILFFVAVGSIHEIKTQENSYLRFCL